MKIMINATYGMAIFLTIIDIILIVILFSMGEYGKILFLTFVMVTMNFFVIRFAKEYKALKANENESD